MAKGTTSKASDAKATASKTETNAATGSKSNTVAATEGTPNGDAGGTPNGVVAAEGWGTAPATPAASGNGAHLAETVPPAPAVGGTPVENDAPGQGRVTAPDADTIPADAPVAAVPQAEPGTPDHHDATAEGQGPGGTTLDPEVAKRTGAAIADPDAREPVGGTDYVNDLARHSASGHNNPTHVSAAEPGGELAFGDDGNMPKLTDMLRSSHAIASRIAAGKREAQAVAKAEPAKFEPLTEFVVEPHPNEKVNDAIGSTHDVGGREVVKVSGDAEGLPVYVGTAQPVEQPDAQWRANSAA